jgi:hypothetical protein
MTCIPIGYLGFGRHAMMVGLIVGGQAAIVAGGLVAYLILPLPKRRRTTKP